MTTPIARAFLFVLSSLLAAAGQAQPLVDGAKLQALFADYCTAWSEPDTDTRRQILEKVWAVDGQYSDPTANVMNRQGLMDLIGRVLGKYPGARFSATSIGDLHHGMFRVTWRMEAPDGKLIVDGIDFGELSSDGRIQRITGFFGAPKPRGPEIVGRPASSP
jgi:hypothetical protein